MKRKHLTDPLTFLHSTPPPFNSQVINITSYISRLEYGEKPDYSQLQSVLWQIMVRMNVNMYDSYDWHDSEQRNILHRVK